MTILVVEDNQALRRLALSALQHRGYHTLEASDGETGLAVFARHQDDVDLILTDVTMPVLSGPAMVEKILQVQPAAKVIFMTGSPEGIHTPSLEGKSYHVLPKPFTAEGLTSSIQRCLEDGR